jgi:two-component system CheB/CheR fusion protein
MRRSRTVGDPGREPAASANSSRSAANERAVRTILRVLQERAGSDFSGLKRTTLLRRLERRRSLKKAKDLAAYARLLEADPAELKLLGDEILIHVTSFFRDPETFEALKSTVFPALAASRAPNAPVRLWVPGCSTGEEVYSLTIALLDYFEEQGLSFPVQVFGTDLSERVIAVARQGRYAEPAVSPRRRRRYFTSLGDGKWQVSKAIRELCVFAVHDLTRDPPYSNLDLVSCRNVLIYFDQPVQEKVIPIFHYALAPGGFLLLGPSESIDSFADRFTMLDKAHRIFAKTPAPAKLPPGLRSAARTGPPPPSAPVSRKAPAKPPSLAELSGEADRVMLSASAPSLIVSESLEIVEARGDVRPFVALPMDKAGANLAKVAHEGLLFPATQAIEQARLRRVPIVVTSAQVRCGQESRAVQLQVVPLGAAAGKSHFLVVFAPTDAPPPPHSEPLEDAAPQTRERYLERELRATRRSLESVIAKQQATNEELQSINEELRSRNEEYHSSLEELQTTHEELQSSNEELATLNDELRKRTAELDQKNAELIRFNEELRKAALVRNRLAALVESSDDAIIGKTLDGVIETWNYGAEKLFGYTAREAIGRSIEMLIPPGRLNEEPAILERIRRGERIAHYETQRRRKDGAVIDVSVSISPISDAEGRVVGASKIARDVTERKRRRELLERTVAERTAELRAINEELEAFCYAVAHDLRAPLRGISGFSQLLQQKLQLDPSSAEGRDFQRIIDNAKRMAQLISGLLDLSRLTRQPLKPEPVDLSVEARSIAQDLQGPAGRKGTRFVIAPGLRARGDANLLRALLQNLLENSWKFTAKHPRATIEFGAKRVDGGLAFFVRDDGAGFDPSHAQKLFTVFHRLHRPEEFPGTGIGLATAMRIVTRHGGRLWAEGAVEKGAVFYFTLAPEPARDSPP